jgi:hypothetical protein
MTFEPVLQAAALVLSVVNGVALLRNHLRDRPKLIVKPIYPAAHQLWALLDGSTRDGPPARRYGFLAYVSVLNRGLRPVSLEDWTLEVPGVGGFRATLSPLSIPEPEVVLGVVKKVFPVLGQKGASHSGGLRVEPGGEVSGMAFFVLDCFGGPESNPVMAEGAIGGTFRVSHIFGGKASCKIVFRCRSAEEFGQLVPGVHEMIQQIALGEAGSRRTRG